MNVLTLQQNESYYSKSLKWFFTVVRKEPLEVLTFYFDDYPRNSGWDIKPLKKLPGLLSEVIRKSNNTFLKAANKDCERIVKQIFRSKNFTYGEEY
jgi:hypothetical protein